MVNLFDSKPFIPGGYFRNAMRSLVTPGKHRRKTPGDGIDTAEFYRQRRWRGVMTKDALRNEESCGLAAAGNQGMEVAEISEVRAEVGAVSVQKNKERNTMSFKPAVRRKSKLRMALDGPAGSGKTLSALRFAFALAKSIADPLGRAPRVAVIDTESGSASKYQGDNLDGVPFEFDVMELSDFAPDRYTEAIKAAGLASFGDGTRGYDVLIIDSLSHAWTGKGGALEMKDKQGGNSFTAWKNITPLHNAMVEAIIRCPCHVITTMRSKMEYVLEIDANGKSVPKKVGMGPVQRAGMEYEFDIVGDLDWTHILTVSKSRCSAVADAIVTKPGAEFMQPIIYWLTQGAEVPQEMIDEADIVFGQSASSGAAGTNGAANGSGEGEKSAAEKARERAERMRAQKAAEAAPANASSSPLAAQAATAATAGADSVPHSAPAQQSQVAAQSQPVTATANAPAGAEATSPAVPAGQAGGTTAPAEKQKAARGRKSNPVPTTENATVAAPAAAQTAPAPATAGQAAPAAAASTAKPKLIDPKLMDEINKCWDRLQAPLEVRVQTYAKRNHASLAEFTQEEAEILHQRLVETLGKRLASSGPPQPGGSAASPAAPAGGVPAGSAAAPT